ncbi:MAG: 30S ribosomal protein S3, partial [Candidatus Falkowbacteria bacterium]|nr:30S ribosomal protein S3 [Candidatus Falkowbacteria bacterium]
MGRKVNPKIFRIGTHKTWQSKWFASGKKYIQNLSQDISLRRYLVNEFRIAGVDRVEIERSANKITVT